MTATVDRQTNTETMVIISRPLSVSAILDDFQLGRVELKKEVDRKASVVKKIYMTRLGGWKRNSFIHGTDLQFASLLRYHPSTLSIMICIGIVVYQIRKTTGPIGKLERKNTPYS
jgi:hypothetical protein